MTSTKVLWLFYLLFLSLCAVKTTMAFSNLLPCYVEFDEEEVVMHHHIVPFEKADTVNQLRLQVRPQGGDTWTTASDEEEIAVQAGTVYEVRFDLQASRIEIDDFDSTVEVTKGGSFAADATTHCENLRALATGNRNVKFTVADSSDTVTIVGAWALGHEAVTLSLPAKLRVSAPAKEEL